MMRQEPQDNEHHGRLSRRAASGWPPKTRIFKTENTKSYSKLVRGLAPIKRLLVHFPPVWLFEVRVGPYSYFAVEREDHVWRFGELGQAQAKFMWQVKLHAGEGTSWREGRRDGVQPH